MGEQFLYMLINVCYKMLIFQIQKFKFWGQYDLCIKKIFFMEVSNAQQGCIW